MNNLRELLRQEIKIIGAPVHVAVAAVSGMGHDDGNLMLIRVVTDPGVMHPVVFIPAAPVEEPKHREFAFRAVIRQDHVHGVVQQQNLRAEVNLHQRVHSL